MITSMILNISHTAFLFEDLFYYMQVNPSLSILFHAFYLLPCFSLHAHHSGYARFLHVHRGGYVSELITLLVFSRSRWPATLALLLLTCPPQWVCKLIVSFPYTPVVICVNRVNTTPVYMTTIVDMQNFYTSTVVDM